ncbi:cation diffusion facilitator family transporter [Glaesserella parasuis]|uniref:cation diffusion facilitator family transporter n=1 Tax=Glaesserella parasuis TaxID=738 RepID=UPI0013665589|nr:cation diffusion facilitator family transporter [Glaesserella parasuis]MCT8761091.1 cation diffusion facilitator family transporter [Glaesserella parasuis]MCT8767857.1 cation diffusion facilitator family transporter [Glaesserella parasuis]MDG6338826.1 cation diffusion facilitator family transporter [Glaesserella parasuis]MDG6787572.1 cation diffusion facilitator family transporter [Glaesserella parasuis]MDG6816886.1 cation diffusion facilitator family transporter [Glaesserella parasuis]
MACQSCCSSNQPIHQSPKYKKALWIVLVLNLSMFFVEIVMGIKSGSTSLLSDSLDFLGDSANYLISLIVLPMALSYRAKASMVKGLTMGVFGLFILITTVYRVFYGEIPSYSEMSIVGFLALLVNVSALLILLKFRDGDSNVRSVWLCSRNDAIGNVAVILAGIAVYFFQSKYPDLIVAFILAFLALQASQEIIKRAWVELKVS